MTLQAYIGNDNVIRLTGLQNKLSGAYYNAATVTYDLQADGTSVDSGSMSYVSGTNGEYRATLADTLSLSAKRYVLLVSANCGVGLQGYWELPLSVVRRTT